MIHPTSPAVMYAGTAGGGVWRTTNGGASWVPRSDFLRSLSVSALAMDPDFPEVLYAGTGEGFGNDDAIRGAGIYKSTDSATSWTHLASTTTAGFRYVFDIVVSEGDSDRVYAATSTGVWRSRDAGQTWSKRLAPNADDIGCTDLAIRTHLAADVLLASCGSFEQSSVYRNANAGGAGVFTVGLSETNMGRTSLAIAPSDQRIAYAIAATNLDATSAGPLNGGGLHAVFRSTDGGKTWAARHRNTEAPPLGTAKKKLNNMLLTNPILAYDTECFGGTNQFVNVGWFSNAVAVDPVNPHNVWAGGVDTFRSNDAGTTWGTTSSWWAAKSSPHFVQADQHVFAFHPAFNATSNRTMFASNDGGVFRTDNARASRSWVNQNPCQPDDPNQSGTETEWTDLNNGFRATQFNHGTAYPDASTYIGGAQDAGTLRGSSGAPDGWATLLPETGADTAGGYTAVNPTNTNILYGTYESLSIHKSINGGASFSLATNGITGDNGFLRIAPLSMDPAAPARLWTGGFFLHRTTNSAGTWQRASAVTPGTGKLSAVGVSPVSGNRVIAGLSDGFIVYNTSALTSTGATSWPNSQPRPGFVSSVLFHPTSAAVAYVTYATHGGDHLWKTVNSGATWTAVTGSAGGRFPAVPAHSIAIDPVNPKHIYVGTDIGIYKSLDGGATWADEATFPNAVVETLQIVRVGTVRTLFAFTHGRGAWSIRLT